MKKQGKKAPRVRVGILKVRATETPALRKAGEAYFAGKRGKPEAPVKRPTREEKEQYILDLLATHHCLALTELGQIVGNEKKSPFYGMSESTVRRTVRALAKAGKVNLPRTPKKAILVALSSVTAANAEGGEKPASEATIATSAVVRSREFRKAREAAGAASAVLDDLVGDAAGVAPVKPKRKKREKFGLRKVAEAFGGGAEKPADATTGVVPASAHDSYTDQAGADPAGTDDSSKPQERQKTEKEIKTDLDALDIVIGLAQEELQKMKGERYLLKTVWENRHLISTTEPLPPTAPAPLLSERVAEIIK